MKPIVRDRRDWWRMQWSGCRLAGNVLWILVRPWRWNDDEAWR